MAAIFGQQRRNKPDPVALGLRVQSSLFGTALPIGCGRYRLAGNLIDYAGFKATPAKQQGGKGGLAGASGKGNTGQYEYHVWGIVSLGDCGISAFNRIHNGNSIDFLIAPTSQELADLNAIGINSSNITTGNSYAAIFHGGTWAQTADSTWTAQFPSQQALAYPGQAYVIFPNLGLGSSPSFPSFSFDVTYNLNSDIPALGPDVNAADWFEAFLTNADWGVQGFPASAIGDFDTARNYWRATGMLISYAMTSPTAANSHMKDVAESLNVDFRWSNGKLDLVPLGDVAVTGNGYTYTPNTTPVYAFGPADCLPNQGSLGGSRGKVQVGLSIADTSQIPNVWRIEYLDRANLYNPVPVEHANDADIAESGQRRYGDKKTQHWFCLPGAASVSCALQLHRAWSTINTYQWTVGRRFILADVLDLVTITEPTLQLVNHLVRITDITENSDGSLTMTAEEVPLTASAPVYARQPAIGIARNTAVAPGPINTPIIMELPGQLSQALEIQAAVSGQDAETWGGCRVWVSTDAGGGFQVAGEITTPARTGVLTASLAAVATTPSAPTSDTTHTLSVDLTASAGELASGTADDLAALSTICLVGSEIVAFQNATLTAAHHYDLTTLLRGCYGTQAAVTTHAIGSSFVRLDDALWRWPYTNALIGKTIYLKFTSFNIYGTNEESLADVPAYSHVLSGTPTPAAISITSATLTQVGVANTLAVAWTADPLAVSYVVSYSTNGGSSYTAAPVTGATSWSLPGLQVSDVYVRVAGVSANGVAGPNFSAVHVVGPAINYGAGLGLSWNDLRDATQGALDHIGNEETIILGAVSAALANNAAIVSSARATNANVTTSIVAQSTATSSLSAQVTALNAGFDGNLATINQTLTTQADAISAISTDLSSFEASTGSSIATLTTNYGTLSDAVSAISTDVVKVQAASPGGSAGGTMAFVASSSAPAGAYAAWSLEVTATGHATSSAAMTVQANIDGTSAIGLRADSLLVYLPGYSAQPVMTVANVSGTPTLAFNGNIVADGTMLNHAYANGSLGHSGVIQSSGTAVTTGNLVLSTFGRSTMLVVMSARKFFFQSAISSGQTVTMTLTANGSTVYTCPVPVTGNGDWVTAPATTMFGYVPPGAGTVTLNLTLTFNSTPSWTETTDSAFLSLSAFELGA